MSDRATLDHVRQRFLASYAVALALLVAASLAAHLYIEPTLGDEREAARMVNMSGAQRMLSQRTLALSQSLSQTPDTAKAEHLAVTLNRFLAAHGELRAYALSHPMPADRRAAFDALLTGPDGLDAAVERFIALAEPAQDRALSASELQALEAMAYGDMFAKLDRTVSLFQRDAEAGLSTIDFAHMLQLAVIAIVLIGEALFIFWPLTRRLVAALKAQIEAREKAEAALRLEQSLDASKQRFVSLLRTDFLDPLARIADHLNAMKYGDRAAWPARREDAIGELGLTRKRVTAMVDFFDDWRRKFGEPTAGDSRPGAARAGRARARRRVSLPFS